MSGRGVKFEWFISSILHVNYIQLQWKSSQRNKTMQTERKLHKHQLYFHSSAWQWEHQLHGTEHALYRRLALALARVEFSHLTVPPVRAERGTSCRATDTYPNQTRHLHRKHSCLTTALHLHTSLIPVPFLPAAITPEAAVTSWVSLWRNNRSSVRAPFKNVHPHAEKGEIYPQQQQP